MVIRWICLPLALGLALAASALVQCSAKAEQDGDRIGQLVKQLGSNKYAEREKAKKELEAMGTAVLDRLREASKTSDLEASRRCQDLIKKLEGQIAAEVLLAPKKVKLSFKDITVVQAIEELQKQSGYQIILDGARIPLTKRTVSLETGEVTFWEAFDQLCQAAKLQEVPAAKAVNNALPILQKVPMLQRVQVQPLPVQPPAKQVPPLPVQPPAKQAPPLPVQPPVILPVPAPLPPPGGQPGQAGGGIQIMPGQIQARPLQPIPGQMGEIGSLSRLAYAPGTIIVRDGVPEKFPTAYRGSLRIRLLPANRATDIIVQPSQKGEAVFILDVSAEPRLQEFAVVGLPRVEKAIDDAAQELATAMDPTPGGNGPVGNPKVTTSMISSKPALVRQVALRLKLGEKQAKHLKELTGSLTIQALGDKPQAIITVAEVLKSAGKTFKGEHGGSIEVLTLVKQANGSYRVQIHFEAPPQFFPVKNGQGGAGGGPQIQVQGGAAIRGTTIVNNLGQTGLPGMVDAKGKELTSELVQRKSMVVNGQLTHEFAMVFRAGAGVGEPAQMVLLGYRMTAAQVPFRFEGVDLP